MRLDHERHRHRQHLPLAPGERSRRAATTFRKHGKAREHRIDPPARDCGISQPPISRFSRTDKVAKIFCSCGTKAMPRRLTSRGLRWWIGSPRRVMLPRVGCSRPAMVFSSVDFPAPFGPMIATISFELDGELRALQNLIVATVARDDIARLQKAHRRRPM